ncbi:arginine/serine-rich coiled-coil protein 2-like [Salvelinus fontinalis]|uniref:arginine/serine-rich coiled-coil protein 2-like n=1 Tax=Salvelinus fontinalis TaxID=8038 RepID=UPI002485670B|nr:arginine/serine-rich coiled-coil protein 2-like [Salvelinus fontinalis]
MAASDADSTNLLPLMGSLYTDRRKHTMESSKSPRSSKYHPSRSRSHSRDRKRKSSDKKHRRSRSRSKEAQRRDSEKPSKSHSKQDDLPEQTERGRERLSAENGEERHRRKDKKGRSHSRSHSCDRRHRSRSRDKLRSRSPREKKKRARSRSGSKTKHRRRSKSRERKKKNEKVHRKEKSRSRSVSPQAFRGRNTAMDAQEALARRLERAKKLQEQKEKEMLEKQHQEVPPVPAPLLSDTVVVAAAAATHPVLNVAALLASGTQVTPQIAMAAQMAALQAKTLAETGIAVPSYYNPSAVNPLKFAEQEKKRKKLWQGKKEGDKSQTAELWEKLNFGNKDQNVKFRKLMGIKGEEEGEASKPLNDEGLKTLQQQEEMFHNLDVQYEMARSQTHTQRGMGLGFGSSFSRGMDAI